jgi:HTH-type transcriptional regulator/antitoxin HipB
MAMLAFATPAQIGAAVRGARKRQGLTQTALAERAGVSRRWLITLESGQADRAELGKVLDTFDALGLELTVDTEPRPQNPVFDLLDDL